MDFAAILEEEQRIYEHESRVFEEMRPLCKQLDIPLLNAKIGLKVLAPDREVLVDRNFFSHSFTLNQLNSMLTLCCFTYADDSGNFGVGYNSGKDKNGVIQSSGSEQLFTTWGVQEAVDKGFMASITTTSVGTIIGTDNTAEDITDYDLNAAIAHGSGGGQMLHAASVHSSGWNAGSSYYWVNYNREFQNDSGGSITVNEMALRRFTNTLASYVFVMSRDLISGGQAVADGETLAVDYELRHSY